MIKNTIVKQYIVNGTICFIVAFVTLYLFAISISPVTSFEGWDSCVFKQMGLAILQGKTPYVDLFDHKGPILYLLNALGLWIGGRWGLFMLNVLNITLTLYLWTKTAQHYVSGFRSYAAVVLILIVYLSVMTEGNMTEDWCLLPLSYSLYIASKFLSTDKSPSFFESTLAGVSAAIIIFIRANNITLLLCSAGLIVFLLIKKRKYYQLIHLSLFFLVGLFVTSILVLGVWYHFYSAEGVRHMIYGTFLFNFAYGSWNSYYDFFISSIPNHLFFFLTIAIITTAYLNNRNDRNRNVLLYFYVLTFLLSYFTMGRAAFRHYLITVVPLFVMCSAYAFRNNISTYILYASVVILNAEPFFKHQLQYSIGNVATCYAALYKKTDRSISAINKEDRNDIWNYNARFDGMGILHRFRLIQANRVVLNFQYETSSLLRKYDEGRLEATAPKYIFIDPQQPFVNKRDSVFISNNYQMIEQMDFISTSKNAKAEVHVNLFKHK